MIKRTIYIGNPAYIRLKDKQMEICDPEDQVPKGNVPVEDLGLLVLDHHQITITSGLTSALIENNVAIVHCNWQHLPHGLVLPIEQNSTFTEKLRAQLSATVPLNKQLWRQVVQHKIRNQAAVLKSLGIKTARLAHLYDKVKSGDPDNIEGQASYYYWQELLDPFGVTRKRDGGAPNHLLNYGYAILRAITARALVANGMLPAVGIHHTNKYNAFCLADDIMEPYRPVVDRFIFGYLEEIGRPLPELMRKEDKAELLKIPVIDVMIEGKNSPLMVAMGRTTAGLMKCYEGTQRKIPFPDV